MVWWLEFSSPFLFLSPLSSEVMLNAYSYDSVIPIAYLPISPTSSDFYCSFHESNHVHFFCIPKVSRKFLLGHFFPRSATLWIRHSHGWFLKLYNLNFKSRDNRYSPTPNHNFLPLPFSFISYTSPINNNLTTTVHLVWLLSLEFYTKCWASNVDVIGNIIRVVNETSLLNRT